MKKRRTSVFFENEEFDQIKAIADQNEQTLAWVIRKIVSGFINAKNEMRQSLIPIWQRYGLILKLYLLASRVDHEVKMGQLV